MLLCGINICELIKEQAKRTRYTKSKENGLNQGFQGGMILQIQTKSQGKRDFSHENTNKQTNAVHHIPTHK